MEKTFMLYACHSNEHKKRVIHAMTIYDLYNCLLWESKCFKDILSLLKNKNIGFNLWKLIKVVLDAV